MKRLAILFGTLSLLMASCTPKADLDDSYNKVYPGIQIYQVATTTNSLSLDGPEVAFRLGILLAEAESQELPIEDGEIEWDKLKDFTYPGNSKKYNLKDFFFGSENMSTITKNGTLYTVEFGSEDGKYKYGYGLLDRYVRSGTFQIETNGLALEETDQNSAWSVSIKGDEVDYGSRTSAESLALAKSVDGYVWYAGEGAFGMSSVGYRGNYTDSPNVVSSWDSFSEVAIEDYESLAYSDIKSAEYSYTVKVETGGKAINGLEMDYATGGLLSDDVTPLTYEPSSRMLNAINGREEVKLKGEYSTYIYPAAEVSLTWTNSAAVIEYNGVVYNSAI